jgi:hypothetical protein
MNRSYTAESPYSLSPTERIDAYADGVDELGYEGLHDADEYGDFEDYEDFEDYDEARIDRRWMWVAGVAGLVLFIAVVCTGVILGGGDSGSVSTTMTSGAPSTSAAPATTASLPPAAALPSLPPETVTTVSPTASAIAPPIAPAPVEAAPPPPAPAPRTITYRVTGNRQLIDMVTVIYTDQQGALQTDVNVALPWAKTVVLDPGVELSSVTATSLMGQLNCGIYDATGALVAGQNNNSMIATCTK